MAGQHSLGSGVELRVALGLLLAACFTVGCGDDETSTPGGASSGAGGEGGGYEEPKLCPDPEDPDVSYVSDDPSACVDVELPCSDEAFGFNNACGCGCIVKGGLDCQVSDPDIQWIATDPARCEPEPPSCELGYVGFSNTCGCGCVPK